MRCHVFRLFALSVIFAVAACGPGEKVEDAGTVPGDIDAGGTTEQDAGSQGADAGVDGGFDGGVEDAGFDAGFDAGTDAGIVCSPACSSGSVCIDGGCMPSTGAACGADGGNDCAPGLQCGNGVCCSADAGTCCASAAQCANGLGCEIASASCFEGCTTYESSQCGSSSTYCFDGGCVAKLTATCSACADGRQCASGVCSSGYCDTDAGTCGAAIPAGCLANEVCGNGSDDDCDGLADEECACGTQGLLQRCFNGAPGRRNVGACLDGWQVCGSDGGWSACNGAVLPSTADTCDGVDNDCNGQVDQCQCCAEQISCPTTTPDAALYAPYVINGSTIFAGPASSWAWTVSGTICDDLSLATTNAPVFTVSGQNTSTLTFTPRLVGDYKVALAVTSAASGRAYSCTIPVATRAPGLRVDLCWDKPGANAADLDLHLHRPGTSTNWFHSTDDCHYNNCKAATFQVGAGANWGLPNSPLASCQGSQDGQDWVTLGYCHNPRLEAENISTPGLPESFAVDNPGNGSTLRTMVHLWQNPSGGNIKPRVVISCGGKPTAAYGVDPDTLSGFMTGGGQTGGQIWRVADTYTTVDAQGVTQSCSVTPLHPPGQTSGYWFTTGSLSY